MQGAVARRFENIPSQVGRKTRCVEGIIFLKRRTRAGFERFRARDLSTDGERHREPVAASRDFRISLGEATSTVRLKTGANQSDKANMSSARRVFHPTSP
jgi:hypothetical protein